MFGIFYYATGRENTVVGSTDHTDTSRTTHRSNIPLAETPHEYFPLSIFMVGSCNGTFAKARTEDKATVK
jgi:hypothetical protein